MWELDTIYNYQADSLTIPPTIIKNDTTTEHFTIQFNADSTFTVTNYSTTPPVIDTGTYSISSGSIVTLTSALATTSYYYMISGNMMTEIYRSTNPGNSQVLTITYTRQ